MVEKDRTKEGRTDLLGNEFVDPDKKDLQDKFEKTGFKIRFKMEKSSLGVDGRSGELTYDFHKGIVNTHEEVYQLGVNLGIIQKPNNVTHSFKGQDFRGKEAMLIAIRDTPELYKAILNEVKILDG